MRKELLRYITFGLFCLLLTGCIPSLHPFYTPDKLVPEPALSGTWEVDTEAWTFSEGEGGMQTLNCRDKDGRVAEFQVHHFKLGEQAFIDLWPLDTDSKKTDFYRQHIVPAHTCLRIRSIGSELQLEALDPEWVSKLLKEKPEALKHEVVENAVLLTASSKELQAFIVEHAETKGAWMELSPLKKQ